MSTIVVFFSLYLTQETPLDWFGNNAALSTADWMGTAVRSVMPPGETFGPSTWA